MAELSFSQVDALLKYDPETGKLFWKERSVEMFKTKRDRDAWNTRFSGKEALYTDDTRGYLQGSIFGRNVLAHRICWLLATGQQPKFQIDHINRDRKDNRLCNLRDVPASDNMKNLPTRKANKSGVNGVFWSKQANKWAAQIRNNGKGVHLGVFKTIEEAASARAAAEALFGYHPNHGRDG